MLIKLLPFQNVTAAGLATLDMRNLLGFTVNRLVLQLGGTAMTKADFTNIKIKANAKVIFDDSGSNIDARMQYRGIAANASFLTMDFDEIKAKSIVGQQLGAIDTTAGISQLTGEFTIAGATAPTIEGWAQVSAPQVQANGASLPERGLIAKVLNFNHNFGAAGKFPLDIPYGKQGGTIVKRLHLFGATVTAVEIKKNGITIHDSTAAVESFNQTEYGRVPQAGVYTVDFVKDGNMSNALNTANANTMEYYATVSGAGNVQVVAELLDPLNNN